MTFLFINTLYSPYHMGGAEISVQLLSEALVRRGHKVYVISLAPKAGVRRVNGVTAIYIRTRNIYDIAPAEKRPVWQRLVWHLLDTWNPAYNGILRKLLKRIKPDVVNTNNLQGFSVFTWRVLQRLNIPVIHTMRDYYLLCHRTTLFKDGSNCDKLCMSCEAAFGIKRRMTALPDTYIGISQFIMGKHHSLGVANGQAGFIIPNIVAVPQQEEMPDNNYDPGNIKLGFIGRVTAEKGMDYLFAELDQLESDNYTMVIAGAYDAAYQAILLKRYTPRGRVVFMDKMEASDFYKSVDVVVIPSAWQEPFGRVAIEAMAWNKPVCIADQGGLSDLYEPDCMWQFAMQPGSLSNVLQQLLQQPEQIRWKAEQCSRFTGKYSADTIATQFFHVAEALCNKTGRL